MQAYPNIQYTFIDEKFLDIALTHPSLSDHAHDYQRYEFLGDSLLSWSISEWLFKNFPDADEGDMNAMRVAIVNGKSLSKKALEMNLDKYLKLSDSQKKNFGEPSPNMLEDTFEALIAAIYLDAGLTAAKDWILKAFNEELASVSKEIKVLNPKGKLQEWSQAQDGNNLPEYKLIKSTGPDHQKVHTVKVFWGDRELGTGIDSSIKNAEINAAKDALEAL